MRRHEKRRSVLSLEAAALAVLMGLSSSLAPSMAMAAEAQASTNPAGTRAGGPLAFLEKQNQTIVPSIPSKILPLYRNFTITVKRGAGNGKLTYKSSNPSIASVSQKGVITGKAPGLVTITVTAAETLTHRKATSKFYVRVKTPTAITSAPKSASWFSPNGAYAKAMATKLANPKYAKKNPHKNTLYAATIDCDKCRLVWCYRGINGWVPFAGYNTIQGVRDTSANQKAGIDWGVEGRLVRSRSFKGAFWIRHKKASELYTYSGTGQTVTCRYLSCYVPYSKNGRDLCQRFEVSTHGSPDTVKGIAKYASQGCCNLNENVAKWIYEKMPAGDGKNGRPNGATVLVFDKVNPLPDWDDCDRSMF